MCYMQHDRFRAQKIDGDALACIREGELPETMFPQAQAFHWYNRRDSMQ